MNFEHLVEINDPSNPVVTPLTREQLWFGLVVRAEQPELSVMALDRCLIVERRPGYLKRELHFGNLQIHDEVTLVEMEHVTYEVSASATFPASRLRMAIEEPFAGRLFLRFTYQVADPNAPAVEDLIASHLKQAYIEADNDTVAVIRRLAKEGMLPPQ
jgi:hypothetical protein